MRLSEHHIQSGIDESVSNTGCERQPTSYRTWQSLMAPMSENGENKNEQELEAGSGKVTDPPACQRIPHSRPYLWVSGQSNWENGEVRFSGFEPCYIACINDLEWKISRKLQLMEPGGDNPGLVDDMRPLRLEYCKHLSLVNWRMAITWHSSTA